MKKFLYLLVIFFACILIAHADSEIILRDYDGIELPKGTFIPVMNVQEISTAYDEIGTTVKFITTNDLYMYETTVIPKGTEIFGYVEKINEPVIGTHAAMRIRISKLKFIDEFEVPIRGYIYSENENIIGGRLTEPKKYVKMPHYQKGFWLGVNQMVPGPERRMGEHTVIAAGADLMIILTQPAIITHTLTN